ncbi:TetR/AcrR family transcriptional regulator [Dyadobacter frigoris]|uniref:TetR/AcrR family transcriptional regulator n=1 Tax=Dyadobacter frigoris TaxID=2576211 RepID=A0A4U6D9E0_9BACT|nr:TetR/AcrR family transcriptional regulator [Dyadobacter frigoris]TKT93406.1 TetR/AcrR family transcriptional regulator [Dyadobacter frigoris]GLU54719.1 hypothetical protein Dfri01_41800 [Dyadobacter frigoris]
MDHLSKGERTRQQLLKNAAYLFNINGIAGTSVDDILKASGVHRGSLYSQFTNKEDLVYACTDYLLNELTRHITMAINREKSAVGKIFAFLELNRNPLSPFIQGGNPILNLSLSADEFTATIQEKIKKVLLNYSRMFNEILSSGVLSGELSADLSIENYSLKMCCTIQGAIAYCSIVQSNLPMHQLVDSLRKELLTYNLRYE